MRPAGLGAYTYKPIDPIIVYPAISVSIAPNAVTGFPISTGTCRTNSNTFYLPWCNLDVGSFRATPSGGNGLGDENNYSYTWTHGSTTIADVNPVTGLGVGSIFIDIDDAYYCPAISSTVNLDRITRSTVSHTATCGATLRALHLRATILQVGYTLGVLVHQLN